MLKAVIDLFIRIRGGGYPSGRIPIGVGRKYGAVTFYRKMLLPRDNLAVRRSLKAEEEEKQQGRR